MNSHVTIYDDEQIESLIAIGASGAFLIAPKNDPMGEISISSRELRQIKWLHSSLAVVGADSAQMDFERQGNGLLKLLHLETF